MPDDAAFIQSAAERYASGRISAENDAITLQTIAGLIVEFVDSLEPHFAKLDVARDVEVSGYRVQRSKWTRDGLAEGIAGEFGNDLSIPAARLLTDYVRGELG